MAAFVWAATVAGNWSVGANWQVGGTPQAGPPGTGDTVALGSGTGFTQSNCTIDTAAVCRALDCTGYTGTLTGNTTQSLAVGDSSGGAFRLATGMTYTVNGSFALSLVTQVTNGGVGFTFFTGGKDLGAVTFDGNGGKWLCADTWTSTGLVTLTRGALFTNGQTCNWLRLVSTVNNTRTLDITNSTINLTVTTTANSWNATGSLLTLTSTGSTIVISTASTNVRTFIGGGKTFNNLTYTVAGSTGQLTITGDNTFSTINFSDVTNARTLSMPTATSTTFTTFNVNGTSGKLMSVVGDVDSTVPQSCSYLSISSSDASGTTWTATNSTNGGSNTGWSISAGLTSLTGTTTPAGALLKTAGKVFTGAVTPVGVLLRTVGKILVGTVTPDGVLLRTISKVLTGAVTPVGVLLRTVGKGFTGTVTPAGVLLRAVGKVLTGTVAPIGVLLRTVNKAFQATVTPVGTLVRTIGKVFTGSTTPAGALTVSRLLQLVVSGLITPSGVLLRTVGKRLSGTVTPAGSLVRTVAKFFAGLISPSGSFGQPPPPSARIATPTYTVGDDGSSTVGPGSRARA